MKEKIWLCYVLLKDDLFHRRYNAPDGHNSAQNMLSSVQVNK
jgi:hypothetical protein